MTTGLTVRTSPGPSREDTGAGAPNNPEIHLIVWDDCGGGRGHPDVTKAAVAGNPDHACVRRSARICRAASLPQCATIIVLLLGAAACDADRDSNSYAPPTVVAPDDTRIVVPDLTGKTGEEAKAA
jgi:hypothetical protein